jgi:UDP-N-acetylmuramoyl-L-alanyl-D-glutamate--2,6-diaminopimelate ligase
LLGRFNALNLLAACGVLLAGGVDLDQALHALAGVRPVPGRMELHGGCGRPSVVVDYAHTPNALEQVLAALREHCAGRLLCVFGCGGDRDRGKRAEMAEVVGRRADAAIVTDDNPRSEDPDRIVADILAGLPGATAYRVERDRARAIRLAVSEAAPNDWVLVAGKGHEDYQLVGDRRLSFSDAREVELALEAVA